MTSSIRVIAAQPLAQASLAADARAKSAEATSQPVCACLGDMVAGRIDAVMMHTRDTPNASLSQHHLCTTTGDRTREREGDRAAMVSMCVCVWLNAKQAAHPEIASVVFEPIVFRSRPSVTPSCRAPFAPLSLRLPSVAPQLPCTCMSTCVMRSAMPGCADMRRVELPFGFCRRVVFRSLSRPPLSVAVSSSSGLLWVAAPLALSTLCAHRSSCGSGERGFAGAQR
jgi:hypothetical protein